MKEMTSYEAEESSPLVGSSKKRSLGEVMSWLATLTRRFWPPEMPFRMGVPIMVFACLRRPKESRRLSMRLIHSDLVKELRVD